MFSRGHSLWINFRIQIIAVISISLLGLSFLSDKGPKFLVGKASKSHSLDSLSIPKTIWHIFLHKSDIPDDLQPSIHSWANLNPTYNYNLVETIAATNILFDLYPTHPDIVHTFQRLESTVMKADFLRYVLLAAYGGVYTDIDTHALEPIDNWIPNEYRNYARVVIGLEYDQRNDTIRQITIPHSVSLCQWTMASVSNHPLMWSVVREVIWAIEERADAYETDIEHLRLTDKEVLTTTGPAIWTAAIVKYLRNRGHPDLTYSSLSGLTSPTLFNDVLIMPIDAFGSGQEHSGSSRGKDGDSPDQKVGGALARHLFKGSWRHSCEGIQGNGQPCWE